LEDLGLDWRKMVKWIYKKWDGSTDWIDLTQDRNRWWTLVNAAMKCWVP
jgi:hypothetical protein